MDEHILGETEEAVKSMPEIINWCGRLCELDLNARYDNDRPVIRLVDAKTREFVATVTVNVPEIRLEEGEVLIRYYSQNAGLLAALEAMGIIEKAGRVEGVGFARLDIYRLLVQPPREPAAEPEGHPADLSTGRLAFLRCISPDALLEDARATRVRRDEVRERHDALSEKLRHAQAEVETIRREIDEAEGTYEDLSQDWKLSLSEIRVASERLASFLAGVEP